MDLIITWYSVTARKWLAG